MSSRIQHSGATNMLDTAAVFLLSWGLLSSEDCTDIRRHSREYDRRWPDPAFSAAAKKPENIGAKTKAYPVGNSHPYAPPAFAGGSCCARQSIRDCARPVPPTFLLVAAGEQEVLGILRPPFKTGGEGSKLLANASAGIRRLFSPLLRCTAARDCAYNYEVPALVRPFLTVVSRVSWIRGEPMGTR